MFFLPGAFLLVSCSEFQTTSHDEAHGAFMALPPYTRNRGRGASWIVARHPAGWAFELGSAMSVSDREADENRIFRA